MIRGTLLSMETWDLEFDVVVAGYGAAGASAAIEAADRGASVMVAERFEGGGASARSGGVVYAGGGTPLQKKHGFEDDPERMFAYLAKEAGDSADEETLRAFCEKSVENLTWLEQLGVTFAEGFHPGKAAQPPDGCGLYYSGNELQRDTAGTPPPRGHVPGGEGMSGQVLFDALARAVRDRKIDVRTHTRVTGLITDEKGAVAGVELATLSPHPAVRAMHRTLLQAARLGRALGPALEKIERRFSRRIRVRARGGVVLATGGFVFDKNMMKKNAPPFAACMPLGTPGDDGTAVRLGGTVGAATGEMDACSALRFTCPPDAFARGILVDQRGERICDESLYAASLGRAIGGRPGGRAWLVIDEAAAGKVKEEIQAAPRLRDQPLGELLSGKQNGLVFMHLTARENLYVNRRKGKSLSALAMRCRIPFESLEQSIERYNRAIDYGEHDPAGKPDRYRAPIRKPPFYAISCHLDNAMFLAPCFTLGGLRTDGLTARVLGQGGKPIGGLYAAGRAAVGAFGRAYLSGLSLADCVFSGRNAGREAAQGADG